MDIKDELDELRNFNNELRDEVGSLRSKITSLQLIVDNLLSQFTEIASRSFSSNDKQGRQDTPNIKAFRDKLKQHLKESSLTFAEVARELGITPGTLSERFSSSSRSPLTEATARDIIKVMLEKQVFKDRSQVEELLGYMHFSDYTAAEWMLFEQQYGQLNSLAPKKTESLSAELAKGDKVEIVSLIVDQGVFSTTDIRSFIRDINNPLGLRMHALNALFSATSNKILDTKLIVELQRDPFRELKIRALKCIVENQLAVGSEVITEALKYASDMDVILNASRAARYSVVNQDMAPEILTHEKFVNHREWGVKSNAVKGIIERDPENAFDLLLPFKTTVIYFRTRDAIADFIETRYDGGTLRGRDLSIAVEMLRLFVSDGHSSDVRMKRLETLLEKISLWSNEE